MASTVILRSKNVALHVAVEGEVIHVTVRKGVLSFALPLTDRECQAIVEALESGRAEVAGDRP